MTLNTFILTLLEIPYKRGGRGYDGASCKGLILIFYRDFLKVPLPDLQGDDPEGYSVERYHELFVKVDRPQLFDVVAFQNRGGIVEHGGVVLDNGKFIHCSRLSGGVSIEHYNEPQHKRRLNGFYRYRHVDLSYRYGHELEKKD
jgi:cell wall-associated NlpC family hydrolase